MRKFLWGFTLICLWAGASERAGQTAEDQKRGADYFQTDCAGKKFSRVQKKICCSQRMAHEDYLKSNYWRETPEERRQAVFPFLWTHIVPHGQYQNGNAIDRGNGGQIAGQGLPEGHGESRPSNRWCFPLSLRNF